MSRAALWISAAFWLVMMTLLVRVEIMPKYTALDRPTYKQALTEVQAVETRRMVVLQNGTEVGTSTTTVTPASDGTFAISNRTSLLVTVAILQSRVTSNLDVNLDAQKELDTFNLHVALGDKDAKVIGKRVGGTVRITIDLGGEKMQQEIPYTAGMITSYFEPFGLGTRLKAGQEWQATFIDPFAQTTRIATVKVGEVAPVEIFDRDRKVKTVQAYKITLDAGEMRLVAWATADGSVLREETPLGYTLVYREGEDD